MGAGKRWGSCPPSIFPEDSLLSVGALHPAYPVALGLESGAWPTHVSISSLHWPRPCPDYCPSLTKSHRSHSCLLSPAFSSNSGPLPGAPGPSPFLVFSSQGLTSFWIILSLWRHCTQGGLAQNLHITFVLLQSLWLGNSVAWSCRLSVEVEESKATGTAEKRVSGNREKYLLDSGLDVVQ